MDNAIGEILRRFFGFGNPRKRPEYFDFDDEQHEDCDCNNGDDDREGVNFFGKNFDMEHMFEHFHGDMQRQMAALHRQMEDMMKGFGVVDFSTVFESPRVPLPKDDPTPSINDKSSSDNVIVWASPFFKRPGGGIKKNPRDFMLKDGVEEDTKPVIVPPNGGTNRIPNLFAVPPTSDGLGDTDLDGKIPDNKLLDIIKAPSEEIQAVEPYRHSKPGFFSSTKSYSFSRIMGPDGKVEKKEVVRDSSGREETTVTRSVGDKSYSFTTIRKPDGTQEERETINNLNETEINRFKDLWNEPAKPSLIAPEKPSLIAPPMSELNPEDKDLFSKLFGRRFR
ncbi:HCLS1-associated protein X-1-like [Physella acuta]|uniref:HCLS1-associated protein X-1-like n=1 Tax=Physella acuta TaxID=109671 RepID=UPI0027DABC17|nr:HCLS1-associated protein X-1-like [Physella acuta]